MFSTAYTIDELVRLIPQQEPFRFIDRITYVDDSRIEGNYFFHPSHEFYKGHFPENPLTPGVILIETMAQIGLVAFGLYLLANSEPLEEIAEKYMPVLTAVDVKFLRKVLPGETVVVKAEKTVFRHGKLVCQVKLLNSDNCRLAEGSISGFMAKSEQAFS